MQAGTWVSVRLVDGSEHAGFVHAVDPETGSVVLLQPVHPEQATTRPVHWRATARAPRRREAKF